MSASTPKRQALRARLSTVGLRRTGPRLAVLELLERSRSPLSHPEIARRLAVRGVDRATVFRNLRDLAGAGLVTRTDVGDHVWRFELRAAGGEPDSLHPHFLCTACGTVSCMPETSVELPRRTTSPGRIDQILLKGRCHDCD